MKNARLIRLLELAAVFAIAIMVVAALGGCKKSESTTTTAPGALTAKSALPLAMSAVETSAPDAKLLLVQSRDVINTTSTPVWQFLIGSPKTDTIYAVTVESGEANAQVYGTADLSAEEWAAVPSADEWKIDSDEAHTAALKALNDGTEETAYLMGFVTYVPKSNTSTNVKPMFWNISFNPDEITKAETNTVEVNVTSGEATVPK